jgi:hypothetical protein
MGNQGARMRKRKLGKLNSHSCTGSSHLSNQAQSKANRGYVKLYNGSLFSFLMLWSTHEPSVDMTPEFLPQSSKFFSLILTGGIQMDISFHFEFGG